MEQGRSEMEKKVKQHVFVLPYPGQSHMNPMLQFARRLVSKGLKATLVTTISIANSLHLGSSNGSLQIEAISDGHDEDPFANCNLGGNASYFPTLKKLGSDALAQLIKKYETTSCPVDCIIYEPFLPWALDVAKQYGLLAAASFTQPCALECIYLRVYHKLLDLPISSINSPVSIPGLPLLELQDIPTFINLTESFQFNMYMEQYANLHKADFVLINTFYKLEDKVIDVLSKDCPVLAIGPTIPSIYLDNRVENDSIYGLDLLTSDESKSTDWLSTKSAGSVVYVAFGSLVAISEDQMEEVAWALKNTNFSFLWVVRATEEAKIPKNFMEEVGEKGLMVNWTTQVKILSNEAVGCFLTHSGWNSTIEALSMGVPMVAMPQWSDEPTNAKLVQDVWKVGIRAKADGDGVVRREEIELCLKEVMEGEKGRELKINAKKWRDLALEAVSEGGTSDKNIDEFASKLIRA